MLLLIMFYVMVLFVCYWAYRDALARGTSQIFAIVLAIGVYLAWLIVLPLWLILRPNVRFYDPNS